MANIGDHTTGRLNAGRRPANRNRTLFLTEADRQREVNAFLPDGPLHPDQLVDCVTCGDSLQIMPFLPDGCVDLVLADPPYNIGKDFGRLGQCRWRRQEYADWLEQWISQCARLLREGGSCYVCCDWRFSGLVHEVLDGLLTVRNRITWRREKGRGAKRNWKNNLEDIFFATKGEQYTFNLMSVMVRKPVLAPYRDSAGRAKDWRIDQGQAVRDTCPSNIWTDLVVPFWSMPENTAHPAQKSEKLIGRILAASSQPGELVLDPFLGSGTSAVMARRMGRRFIGIEINPDYCRLAQKRLAVEPVEATASVAENRRMA